MGKKYMSPEHQINPLLNTEPGGSAGTSSTCWDSI